MAEKGNTKFSVTLNSNGSTEYSDKMVDEVLKDFCGKSVSKIATIF